MSFNVETVSATARKTYPSDGNRRASLRAHVLRPRIDAVGWDEALQLIAFWSARREPRCVYQCNVHSVVTADRDATFSSVLEQADLALPDGAPIAWALRSAGFSGQPRLSGPDIMWRHLAHSERVGEVVSFFGSTPEILAALRAAVVRSFPALRIGVMISPPFRNLTADEGVAFAKQINDAGTNCLCVGLGCPKQEIWMHENRFQIQAVMLGVGAAFAFHAGLSRRAPQWMQSFGLEWVHRLISEPRRLVWRYFLTNSYFIARMMRWMPQPGA